MICKNCKKEVFESADGRVVCCTDCGSFTVNEDGTWSPCDGPIQFEPVKPEPETVQAPIEPVQVESEIVDDEKTFCGWPLLALRVLGFGLIIGGLYTWYRQKKITEKQSPRTAI